MPKQSWRLEEGDVRFVIDFAIDAAREAGVAVTVAVMETGGHLVGSLRMEGARLASIDGALKKAWTAAIFQRPSSSYMASILPGGDAYGMWNAYPGKLVPLPGGQPIMIGEDCVGGLGISGGPGAVDEEVATNSVAALLSRINATYTPGKLGPT